MLSLIFSVKLSLIKLVHFRFHSFCQLHVSYRLEHSGLIRYGIPNMSANVMGRMLLMMFSGLGASKTLKRTEDEDRDIYFSIHNYYFTYLVVPHVSWCNDLKSLCYGIPRRLCIMGNSCWNTTGAVPTWVTHDAKPQWNLQHASDCISNDC